MPKRAGVIWTHEKPSCFSQTPFRAERDARMSEMKGLKIKLARIWDRGCKVLVYVAQDIIFPTSTELAVLKQTMSQSWCQSSVIDTHVTLQFTGLMPVFPTTMRTLGDTPRQDYRSSRVGGPWANSTAAGYISSYVRPASCE